MSVVTDWEATLRSWVKPPSETEDAKRDKTESQIREALTASTRLKGINYKVYAKGSYANNTNVRLDSDVDIAVECADFFYYDDTGAAADVTKAVKTEFPDYAGGYSCTAFKNDVEQALIDYYGSSAVERGNIAIRVREKKTTLPADVVPCFEYRYIYDIDSRGSILYHQGTRVYPDKGTYIHNWPKQQHERGVTKNLATGRRFKAMVRALKRLENELVTAKKIQEQPSFFMECLVYNVPNKFLNQGTYVADMRAILATIFNATLTDDACRKWLEVSERRYLFQSSQTWTRQQAHEFSAAAWNHIGYK